jgi:hypothetical protein
VLHCPPKARNDDVSQRGLLDLESEEIERRLDVAGCLSSSPVQKGVAADEARTLSLAIASDLVHDHAWTPVLVLWGCLGSNLARAGQSRRREGKYCDNQAA